jgi:hypothetical protein
MLVPEKAIYRAWLFRLVGDILQPLHCTAVFSEHFPEGIEAATWL